jgi:hypothetical protein
MSNLYQYFFIHYHKGYALNMTSVWGAMVKIE